MTKTYPIIGKYLCLPPFKKLLKNMYNRLTDHITPLSILAN
jgi:hypothetical protein